MGIWMFDTLYNYIIIIILFYVNNIFIAILLQLLSGIHFSLWSESWKWDSIILLIVYSVINP